MARGFAYWRQANSPAALMLYPAQELYRAIPRAKHRDWDLIWNDARAELEGQTTATLARDRDAGPFVATRNDQIWTEISRFDLPYPPFDYGSGMRVRDVPRARAIELDVIAPDTVLKPALDPLNVPWTVPHGETTPQIAQALQESFADRARTLPDGSIQILPNPRDTLPELIYRAASDQAASASIAFARDALRSLFPGAKPDATVALPSRAIRSAFSAGSVRLPDILALPRLLADVQDVQNLAQSQANPVIQIANLRLALSLARNTSRILINAITKAP
jgi:hypothetical protein